MHPYFRLLPLSLILSFKFLQLLEEPNYGALEDFNCPNFNFDTTSYVDRFE